MSVALLVQLYDRLASEKSPEGGPEESAQRRQAAVEDFRQKVEEHYTEGTLLRLVTSPDGLSRRAAVLALGLVGTMDANPGLAARLHDEDSEVACMAADALWSIWFRGSTPDNAEELRRLARVRNREDALAGLNELIAHAPDFAEAYNQRAIVYYRRKEYERSIADCERTLQLNPSHFGAQAGIGQCFLQLRRTGPALKALRAALKINPHLDGVAETVRKLEKALGEGK